MKNNRFSKVFAFILAAAMVISVLAGGLGGAISVRADDPDPLLVDLAPDAIKVNLDDSTPAANINRDSSFTIDITYTITDKISDAKAALDTDRDVIWRYDLNAFIAENPELRALSEGATGTIMQGVTSRGTYVIRGNVVYLNINKEWLRTAGNELTGTFSLSMSLDAANIGSKDEVSFRFPGTNKDFELEFKDESQAYSSKYTTNNAQNETIMVKPNEDGTYTVGYSIMVSLNTYEKDSMTVVDTLQSEYQSFDADSFTLSVNGTKYVINDYISVSSDKKTATIDLLNAVKKYDTYSNIIKANQGYYINYTTTVDAAGLGEALTNSYNLTWGGDKTKTGDPVTYKISQKVDVRKSYEDKGNNKYEYTIVIGEDGQDLSGFKITDTMKDLQKLTGSISADNSNVNITAASDNFSDDSFSENSYNLIDYTIPDGVTGPLTITYQVEIPDNDAAAASGIFKTKNITNNVAVEKTNIKGTAGTTFGHEFGVGVQPPTGTKVFDSFDAENGKVNWKITITNPNSTAISDIQIFDYPYGEGTDKWTGMEEETVDWSSITVKDSSGNEVSGSLYQHVVPEWSDEYLLISSIPANETYTIILSTNADLINGRYYKNQVDVYYENAWAFTDTPVQKYNTNEFEMTKDGELVQKDGEEYFEWTVVVNPSRNELDPDMSLYFEDVIPDGMEYVDRSFQVKLDGPNYWSVTGNCTDDNAGYLSYIDNTLKVDVKNFYNNQNIWTAKYDDLGISGICYTITYRTKFTDAEIERLKTTKVTQHYTNSAKVTGATGGTVVKSVDKTIDYDYKVVIKKDLSPSDTGSANDLINFQIDVNPDKLTLNGGEPLTLTDTLPTTVELVNNEFTVTDDEGKDIMTDGTAKVSYNDDSRTITVIVPDKTYVKVNYTVKTRETGNVLVENKATLVGGGYSYEDSTSERHNVSAHSATIQGGEGIQLHKMDEFDIKKELSGAEFDLYEVPFDSEYKMGTPVKLNTENLKSSDSYITLTGLVPGKLYYWQEVNAPEGYKLDSTKHYFVVYVEDTDKTNQPNLKAAKLLDNNIQNNNEGIIVNTVTLNSYVWNVCNTKEDQVTGKLEVKKVFDGIGSADIPDSFKITNSYNDTVFTIRNASGSGTAEDPYKWSLNDLPIGSEVIFTESGYSKSGYKVEINGTVRDGSDVSLDAVQVKEGDSAVSEFVNKYEEVKGSLSFNKYGLINEECSENAAYKADAKAPLQGAVFKLYKADDTALTDPVSEAVSGADGKVTFSNLSEASYLMKEVSAPDPYEASDEIYKVTFDAEGKAEIRDSSDAAVNEIVDDQTRGDIELLKVSEKDNSIKLPDSTYTLFRKSTTSGSDIKIASATTDANGVVRFSGVLVDTDYVVKETAAPDGYYVSRDPIVVKLSVTTDPSTGGKVTRLEAVDMGASGSNVTATIDPVTGAISWLEPEIEYCVLKTDEDGNALPGAALELREDSEDGEPAFAWTSGDSAEPVPEGLLISGKTYYVVETKAPQGYETADPVKFTISSDMGAGESRLVTVIMTDKKITDQDETDDTDETDVTDTTDDTDDTDVTDTTDDTDDTDATDTTDETKETDVTDKTDETKVITEITDKVTVTTDSNTVVAVKTADNSMIGVIMLIAAVSAAGIALIIFKKKG